MFKKLINTKAKKWSVVFIIMAAILSLFNRTIQGFQNECLSISVPARVVLFLVPAIFMYYMPLLRVNHFAKEENNRRLSIISKILIIHFYFTLGIGVIVIIAYFFSV